MKFSTKTRYGVRTMVEIALGEGEIGIFQKDIAINQNISVKYLDQIIAALKVARLIVPFKGRKSGYKLTRSAELISIYDIHMAFEASVCVVDCLCENGVCDRKKICSVVDVWEGLNNQIVDYLKSVNLADLVAKKISIMEAMA